MRKWEELPKFMRTDEVKQYYDILIKHEKELKLKRYFDILLSMILLVILSPIMLVISIAIKLDSPGPVIYKQVRVTQYGKKFHILKFRTMVQNADKMGTQVTISQDSRLTRVGKVIRGCRIEAIQKKCMRHFYFRQESLPEPAYATKMRVKCWSM